LYAAGGGAERVVGWSPNDCGHHPGIATGIYTIAGDWRPSFTSDLVQTLIFGRRRSGSGLSLRIGIKVGGMMHAPAPIIAWSATTSLPIAMDGWRSPVHERIKVIMGVSAQRNARKAVIRLL